MREGGGGIRAEREIKTDVGDVQFRELLLVIKLHLGYKISCIMHRTSIRGTTKWKTDQIQNI